MLTPIDSGAEQYNKLSKECPPIETYPGMPDNFNNRQLVLNGTMNELILKAPCRDGYNLIGNLSDIKQCTNGTWKGHGPKCESKIRAKFSHNYF